MSTTAISIRLDSDIKKQFDKLCNEFGLSTNAAFNLFARTVVREQAIPFYINDSFYARSNLDYLRKVTSEIDSGTAILKEHELLEADE